MDEAADVPRKELGDFKELRGRRLANTEDIKMFENM